MKSLVFVFACLIGVSASAQQSQSGEVRALSQQVNALVQNNIRALPPQSRQYVRDSLQGIVQAFAMAGVNVNVGNGGNHPVPPPPPPPIQVARSLFCDTTDATLRDLFANGALIYDFVYNEDCNKAKAYASLNQPFCDSSDATLHGPNGRKIYDFVYNEDCNKARESVTIGKGFCDTSDATLHRADGSLVYDFVYNEDCQKALQQM